MIKNKHTKKLSYLFAILYVISFFLPSAILVGDTVFGYECAFFLIVATMSDFNEVGLGTFLIDLFLNLSNILVILTFFFYKKIHFNLILGFLIIVFISTGYWTIEFFSDLKIGYWVWFLSSTFFMTTTLLIKRNSYVGLSISWPFFIKTDQSKKNRITNID